MRRLLLAIAICGAISSAAEYLPLRDGAVSDFMFVVRDDEGNVVPNCKVSVAFQVEPEKAKLVTGETETDGSFAAKGDNIGEVNVWIRKSGYYDTHVKPQIRRIPYDKVRETHRWSEGQIVENVVLKRKRKPMEAIIKAASYWRPPVTNAWFAVDFEKRDWCAPYGAGVREDMRFLYEAWNNPTNYLSWKRRVRMEMPNCLDGFYLRKVDESSAFRYDYDADTNAVYRKSFDFTFDRTSGHISRHEKFDDGEYLIFRTRTVTNEAGVVVHGNYGRVSERFDYLLGFRFVAWFNPNDLDTNLEDGRAWE